MGSSNGALSLNTATVKKWSLAQCIEGCARHGIEGISPWRDQLHEMGLRKASVQIQDTGLRVTGVCAEAKFAANDAVSRRAAIDDSLKAIDEAAEIGATSLVMVCGGVPEGSKDLVGARLMMKEGLSAILPAARKAGVTIALEPVHPMNCASRSVLSNIAQSLRLCDLFGAGIGIVIDTYNVWWDPELYGEIALAGDRIVAFHASDWVKNTPNPMLNRGMPGDGVIDVRSVRQACQLAGYNGMIDFEVLSHHWWDVDPDQVLTICKERHSLYC